MTTVFFTPPRADTASLLDAATLDVQVARTAEEQAQAFAIRAIVYMGEQDCPYDEEFDGNDYAATQVLGRIGGEPAATARIRYFGAFAKLERLAIRGKYRNQGHGHTLIAFLVSFCRRKGFHRAHLHAQERLVPFYRGHGFHPVGRPFSFSGYDYVAMTAELAPARAALTLDDCPLRLLRPEGTWDVPGILETSALSEAGPTPAAPPRTLRRA